MYEGLLVNTLQSNVMSPQNSFTEDPDKWFGLLAFHFAMPAISGTTPHMLNKALCGPSVMHWKKVLEYEINQLKRLGTWVIENLPKGETVIPCTEVLREKPGPNGETNTF